MRLMYYSSSFPQPDAPQRTTFNLSLLNAVAEEHALAVVSPIPWTDALRHRGLSSMFTGTQTTDQWSFPVHYPQFYYPPKVLREHADRFLWCSTRKTIQRVIRDFKPEAVLSYWAHPDGAVAVRAAREAAIPAVVMVGGSDVLVLTKNAKRRKAIYGVLNAADKVIAVSEHIRQTMIDNGVAESKVHVIRRGVNRTLFSPTSRAEARTSLDIDQQVPLFVSVGRLVPVKGFETLLAACKLLKDDGFEFQCRLIGDGPLRGTLQTMIETCQLESMVQLVGNQSHVELARWYNAASAVALCSSSEGVPNVLLEAIVCGASFVATDVGGISEIADPQRDILVAEQTPAAIAQALRECCSRSPVETPRRFVPPTWQQSAAAIIDVVQSARNKTTPATTAVAEPLTV